MFLQACIFIDSQREMGPKVVGSLLIACHISLPLLLVRIRNLRSGIDIFCYLGSPLAAHQITVSDPLYTDSRSPWSQGNDSLLRLCAEDGPRVHSLESISLQAHNGAPL